MIGFRSIPARARNSPLGQGILNQMVGNSRWLRNMALAEHTTDGEHNCWEVPRVVGRIDYSAGYTVGDDGTYSDISSVSSGATGTTTLTLAGSRFTTDMRVRVCVGNENKPAVACWEVVSATSLKVYTYALTTGLGAAGNAWALTNLSYNIAIHTQPDSWADYGAALTSPAYREGDHLDAAGYNLLVHNSADLYATLDQAHNATTGAHTVREVASAWGDVYVDTGHATYKTWNDSGSISFNRTSAGKIQVTVPTSTLPLMPFLTPGYSTMDGGTPGDIFVANWKQNSTTVFEVYLYKYDPSGKTWNYADGDFYFSLHGY